VTKTAKPVQPEVGQWYTCSFFGFFGDEVGDSSK
jgi:hypothetical protein